VLDNEATDLWFVVSGLACPVSYEFPVLIVAQSGKCQKCEIQHRPGSGVRGLGSVAKANGSCAQTMVCDCSVTIGVAAFPKPTKMRVRYVC
jgi:hypothetical protein